MYLVLHALIQEFQAYARRGLLTSNKENSPTKKWNLSRYSYHKAKNNASYPKQSSRHAKLNHHNAIHTRNAKNEQSADAAQSDAKNEP